MKGHRVLVVGLVLALGALGCSKKAAAPAESPGAAPFVASTSTTSGGSTTSLSRAQRFGPVDPSRVEFCKAFEDQFTFGPLDTTDDPEVFRDRLNDRLGMLDQLAGFAPPEVRSNALAVREAMARAKDGQDIDALLNDPTFGEARDVVNSYTFSCAL